MKETEITVQVFDSYGETVKKLSEAGFCVKEKYLMTDYYYSKLRDVKYLTYPELMGNTVILRCITEKDTSRCFTVRKNKEFDEQGNVISEEKMSKEVSSREEGKIQLEKEGYIKYITVVNNTSVYKRAEESFALQHISDLGLFIEWEEDRTMHYLSTEEKIKELKKRADGLGLNLGKDYFCKKMFMLLNNQS